jgi:hypothetical protein
MKSRYQQPLCLCASFAVSPGQLCEHPSCKAARGPRAFKPGDFLFRHALRHSPGRGMAPHGDRYQPGWRRDPTLLSVYLLLKNGVVGRSALAILIVSAVVYCTARPVVGVGIVVPILVAPRVGDGSSAPAGAELGTMLMLGDEANDSQLEA